MSGCAEFLAFRRCLVLINFSVAKNLFTYEFRRAVLPVAVCLLDLDCYFASFGAFLIGCRLCLAGIGAGRVGWIVGRICHTARKNGDDDEQVTFQNCLSWVEGQVATLHARELKWRNRAFSNQG